MPTYPYAYLTGSLFWLGIWGCLFCLLKQQRREMVWTGLILAPAGPISEFWSLRDYWHPSYVLEFRWGAWRWGGVEDCILSFALFGICAGLFEFVMARRGEGRVPPIRWRNLWRLAAWPALGGAILVSGAALGFRSIHSLFLALAAMAVLMLRRRSAWWPLVAWLSLAAALAYGLFYALLFLPLFPGSIEAVWKLENTWGIRWGGVPLEELVWAGLTMLFTGPYLRATLSPSPRASISMRERGKRTLTEGGAAPYSSEEMDTETNWTAAMRGRIEEALESALSALPQTEVLRAARYAAQGGGHRWRGRMAVAAGAIFRSDAEACVLPLAAALELMHAASLVLDDLPSMDNALTRRGKPCVHLVFPEWVVDMLPAFLVNRAYRVASGNPLASEECRIRSLVLLGEMGGNLARGQELDLALARAPVSEAALLECYALKSGSLFAAALAGGALLCGAGDAEAAALREAGLKLGQAYQILDDVADGPEEDSAYKEAGRFTAFSLFGPEAARARAEGQLQDVSRILERFGPAARLLRGVLAEILPPSS